MAVKEQAGQERATGNGLVSAGSIQPDRWQAYRRGGRRARTTGSPSSSHVAGRPPRRSDRQARSTTSPKARARCRAHAPRLHRRRARHRPSSPAVTTGGLVEGELGLDRRAEGSFEDTLSQALGRRTRSATHVGGRGGTTSSSSRSIGLISRGPRRRRPGSRRSRAFDRPARSAAIARHHRRGRRGRDFGHPAAGTACRRAPRSAGCRTPCAQFVEAVDERRRHEAERGEARGPRRSRTPRRAAVHGARKWRAPPRHGMGEIVRRSRPTSRTQARDMLASLRDRPRRRRRGLGLGRDDARPSTPMPPP